MSNFWNACGAYEILSSWLTKRQTRQPRNEMAMNLSKEPPGKWLVDMNQHPNDVHQRVCNEKIMARLTNSKQQPERRALTTAQEFGKPRVGAKIRGTDLAGKSRLEFHVERAKKHALCWLEGTETLKPLETPLTTSKNTKQAYFWEAMLTAETSQRVASHLSHSF